ncbi:MAG: PilN domain-containing protein [Candidatus Muiribacteriota bacterium]|jgi:Tfp pilus assembly protein PilN
MNKFIRINLLPEKQGIKIPKLPIGTILGLAVIAFVGYYLFVMRLDAEKSVITQYEANINRLKQQKKQQIADKERVRDNLITQINDLRRRINMVKSIITGDDVVAWTRIWESLTEVTDMKKGAGVWITKFNVQPDFRVSMSAVAENDWVVVSNFIEKLKGNEFFSEVNLENAIKTHMDDGEKNVPVFNIEITCRIKKERM